MRRIVVGHSGGVTSAWSLGWALRTFPREEVIALWHDTKKEDEDTLRFLREISVKLDIEVTERSDGRSMPIYHSSRVGHLPMAYWKTADYQPTNYIFASHCQPIILPVSCTVGAAGLTLSNVSITTIETVMNTASTSNTNACFQ